MNITLNDLRKEIFHMVLDISERPDISTRFSESIFFSGMKVIHYKGTGMYSVMNACNEVYTEINNRYLLMLMHSNLKQLCQKNKQSHSSPCLSSPMKGRKDK